MERARGKTMAMVTLTTHIIHKRTWTIKCVGTTTEPYHW